MDLSKRFELIKRNSQEILTENELKGALQKKKQLSAYYGTAPTGLYHMGYLVPLSKLFDFATAGIKNNILLADIHAALDDLKTPWADINAMAEYYKSCIQLSFPWEDQPTFTKGSTFQLTKSYQLDLLKLSTISTVARTTRAASEV